jgi:hypothetical protein
MNHVAAMLSAILEILKIIPRRNKRSQFTGGEIVDDR